jgi:hypothetical protein
MALNRVPLAGLLLALAGCMTVRKVQPAEYIPKYSPAVVWVTANDNSYTPVAQPRIVGDSLKGTWVGLQEPVAIPLSDIQSVQAKMSSPKRTVILVASLGVVSTAVLYTLLTAGNSGNGTNGCPLDKNGQPQNFC